MAINFTGFDVIIRDKETNDTLLMGKVVTYDKNLSIVEINGQPKAELREHNLLVLLYQNGRAYTYCGNYRKVSGSTNTTIALFRGSQKNERKNERFTIDLYAAISSCHSVKTENEPKIIGRTIHIVDISRSGVCIQAIDVPLSSQDKLGISFMVQDIQKLYYAQVLRVKQLDPEMKLYEYGCQLLTPEEYNSQQETS